MMIEWSPVTGSDGCQWGGLEARAYWPGGGHRIRLSLLDLWADIDAARTECIIALDEHRANKTINGAR